MPNTPALVQTGVTALYAPATIAPVDRQLAQQILQVAGAFHTPYMAPAEQALATVADADAAAPGAYKLRLVESCSCEGLAQHVFAAIAPRVRERTAGRAFLVEVEVFEDTRNSAAYRPQGSKQPIP